MPPVKTQTVAAGALGDYAKAARHLGIEDAPFGVIKAVESFRNPDTAARVAATANDTPRFKTFISAFSRSWLR